MLIFSTDCKDDTCFDLPYGVFYWYCIKEHSSKRQVAGSLSFLSSMVFFLKELFMSNILIKLFLSNIREPQRQPIPRIQLSLSQAQINPRWYPSSHPTAQSQQSPQDPTSSPPLPSTPPTAFIPILPAPSRSL